MAGTRRLFIGLAPPPGVAEALCSAARDSFMPRGAAHPRFHLAPDLHLTLLFLGQVDERRIPALEAALERAARSLAALDVEIEGTGAFPTRAHPRTLWAGVRASDPLAEMRTAIVVATREAGVDVPERDAEGPFRPHLTLARLRSVLEGSLLDAFFALEFRARWRADEIVLFQSGAAAGQGSRAGAAQPTLRYRPLGRFPLAVEA